MGEAAESRLTQLHEGAPGLAWWRDRAVRRKSTSGASATGPGRVSRRANSAPSNRADEPPAPQAPGNKPALSTLIARIVLGAVRECDVPVPPCSAFLLLSSLSYSHARPFAVAKATQVCTRNRTSPIAIEESPSRAIRPLDRDGGARAIRDSPSDVGACHRVVRRHTCFSSVTRRSMRATQAREPRLECTFASQPQRPHRK